MTEQGSSNKSLPWPVIIMLAMLFLVIGLGFALSPSSEQDKLWWVNLLGTTNHGVLLNPPIEVVAGDLLVEDGAPWSALETTTFKLVVMNAGNCESACQEMLRSVRQLHVRLNRDYEYVERGFLLTNPSSQTATELLQDLPDYASLSANGTELLENLSTTNMPPFSAGPVLIMIDPSNLAMMAYTEAHSGSEVLEDLEHLLELAR